MSEERFPTQVNAYLLGELTPAQAAAFERSLDGDGALRGLLREREKELERLALEITPQVEPPAAVREKLLAAAAAERRAPGLVTARRGPPPAAGWFAFFLRSLAPATALALLAVCAGLWMWREQARREGDDLRARVQELTAENGSLRSAREESTALRETRARLEREIAALHTQTEASGQDAAALREQIARAQRDLQAARGQDAFARLQVGSLQPPPGAPPTKEPASTAGGFALWDPQRQEGMLVVENLPVPRPDQDYQVWVADPARPQPVPSGVFHPGRAGSQQTLHFVTNERIERATQFMVTLERRGGVNRITGPAVLESLPRR